MSAPDTKIAVRIGADAAAGDITRYVPAPHTASEKAAIEAALVAPVRKRGTLTARIMIGTAAVAMAVVLPDLSLGAIGKPETRVEMDKTLEVVPQSIWTPTARSAQPVYAPVMASDDIALNAITFSSRRIEPDFERVMPVAVLERGSERFDLAFAGGITEVELPHKSVSASMPRQARRPSRLPLRAVRTRIIAMPQIAELPTVGREQPGMGDAGDRLSGAGSTAAGVSAPIGVTSASGSADPSSGTSVDNGFAGPLGVSADVRETLPIAPEARAGRAVQRALPAAPSAPDVGSDALREAALVPKSKLDARINGVLTGRIDFRQLDGTIALRLRSVIGVLRDQFSDDEFAHLVSGRSADRFVTLAELQSAGIPISYNPAYDEVEFGIDYKDAPNAGKVQVPQIGTPGSAEQSVMIEQIPR